MAEFKYLIPGTPISLAKAVYNNDHMYGPSSELHLITKIHLENQHGDRPLFNSAIQIYYAFFFKLPERDQTIKRFIHKTPQLTNLVRFYESVCRGIIWAESLGTVRQIAEKNYSNQPRTEFIITLL